LKKEEEKPPPRVSRITILGSQSGKKEKGRGRGFCLASGGKKSLEIRNWFGGESAVKEI